MRVLLISLRLRRGSTGFAYMSHRLLGLMISTLALPRICCVALWLMRFFLASLLIVRMGLGWAGRRAVGTSP